MLEYTLLNKSNENASSPNYAYVSRKRGEKIT